MQIGAMFPCAEPNERFDLNSEQLAVDYGAHQCWNNLPHQILQGSIDDRENAAMDIHVITKFGTWSLFA